MEDPIEISGRRRWCRWFLAGVLAVGYLAASAGAMSEQPSAEGEAPASSTPVDESLVPESPAPESPAPESPSAEAGSAEPQPEPSPVAQPETLKPESQISTEEGRIILHVKNEDLARVLEQISHLHEVNIVVSRGVKATVSADLYKVTVEEALDALCRASSLRWVQEGNFIYVYTMDEWKAVQEDESRLATEVFYLNYLTGKEALSLIQPVLSKKATTAVSTAAETGIPSGGEEVGGDSYGLPDCLVVRDFPENLGEVRKTLQKMDRRPRQVLVEATILQVNLNDSTSLGVDFNALAGVDFRDLGVATEPTTAPATVMTNAAATNRAGVAEWAQINTQGFATRGTGLNIGIMTNNVSVFINALEEVGDTNILSNPKVLALNKQRAEVIVGQRLGYRTTTVTETTAVESVEFLDVGTQLVFRPFITDDGYVRMEVHPEVSTGAVNDQGLPRKTTTEVSCNVMVKDGHTIVIGGLFDETASITRTQIPGLGNVPGLGWLFRSREDATDRDEIIVLLTPHVIEEEKAYALGEQIRDDVDRRCLGLREGFALLTRERLTVGYLQEADKAWRKFQETGCWLDKQWAWWHTLLALNVAPNNLKAMRLKDAILSEQKGRPMRPVPWTLWDSLQERLKPFDRTQGLVPKARRQAPASDAGASREAKETQGEEE